MTLTAPSAKTLDILSTLIAFPTVSRNSNLGLIEWLRDYLRSHGVSSRLSYDASAQKANLFASLGPAQAGGILLSGHTDVVPVDGQDWSTDPFKATLHEQRIYGRGACDMKGFLAAILGNIDSLLAAELPRPLHLAFTYDEELGCLGVRTLLRDLEAEQRLPALCVVGEPTDMQVVRAHKGSRNYRCCVRGVEAHASQTQAGVNAIQYAAQIIGRIQQLSDQLATRTYPESSFETPYSTIQTSLIQGGLARNIVPRDCEFTFGYRYMPQDDADAIFAQVERFAMQQVLGAMRARSAATDVRFDKLSDNPALRPDSNGLFSRFVSGLAGVDGEGTGVSYMTEGGIYQQAGITTLICGPGSIAQAHKPNEFIELSQLARCELFVQALAQQAGDFLQLPTQA